MRDAHRDDRDDAARGPRPGSDRCGLGGLALRPARAGAGPLSVRAVALPPPGERRESGRDHRAPAEVLVAATRAGRNAVNQVRGCLGNWSAGVAEGSPARPWASTKLRPGQSSTAGRRLLRSRTPRLKRALLTSFTDARAPRGGLTALEPAVRGALHYE